MGKNNFLLIIVILSVFSLFLPIISINSDDTVSVKKYSPPFTPIRITFFPGVWAWPKYCNIYGLNLGLVNSNDERYSSYDYVVAGLDLAWFISASNNVYGLQIAPGNKSLRSAGLQFGWLNMTKKSAGMQLGLINLSEESGLFQLGIYNQGDKKSSLFQFGLINVLDNGFLPFFPIINFTVE